mmetsp:Transcript_40182/g.93774  ORF Transcript_40182/g.93774 Transcript_40182/m.93774 type:complete len:201 (-) Transcript_40182:230-832(-)
MSQQARRHQQEQLRKYEVRWAQLKASARRKQQLKEQQQRQPQQQAAPPQQQQQQRPLSPSTSQRPQDSREQHRQHLLHAPEQHGSLPHGSLPHGPSSHFLHAHGQLGPHRSELLAYRSEHHGQSQLRCGLRQTQVSQAHTHHQSLCAQQGYQQQNVVPKQPHQPHWISAPAPAPQSHTEQPQLQPQHLQHPKILPQGAVP